MSEQTEMRMDAYYYGFDRTGCDEVDKILSAVAHAGKSFHHTEQWNENAHTAEYLTGNTPNDWIQNAANEAAQTIADLRAQLKRVEEERDRAMRAADGARERATRWQETAECEADGLEHWKSACESSKAALAAKEKELERYKWMIEPILAVNAAVTCTSPCVFEKACREAGRRLEGEGSPKVTESVTSGE